MKKYLISGVAPGVGGVGRLMKAMVPKYKDNGYYIIHKKPRNSITQLLYHKKYFHILYEVFARYVDDIFFYVRCKLVYRSEVIFIHPQNAGYRTFFSLVQRNSVSLYVMDNSFFCVQSYNTHPVTNKECLQCINDVSPDNACAPFPVAISKNKNIFYLKKLRDISWRINFLCQCSTQKQLLELCFGDSISVDVCGMDTAECQAPACMLNEKYLYSGMDIVFHGHSHPAKGVIYVLVLAEYLPEYQFFVPDDASILEKIYKKPLPKNVLAIKVSWETGLRAAVQQANLVINPSMWSAPIEGALIKSSCNNPNIATVITQYGFETVFDGAINHLHLSSDAIVAARQISNFLSRKPRIIS